MADFTGNYCWVKVVDLDKENLMKLVEPSVVMGILGSDRPPKIRKGWQLDKDYEGSNIGNLCIEHQSMEKKSRDEAIEWLGSEAGRDWLGIDKDPLGRPITYFLACFGTDAA